jgi:hypothetical protein
MTLLSQAASWRTPSIWASKVDWGLYRPRVSLRSCSNTAKPGPWRSDTTACIFTPTPTITRPCSCTAS